MLPNGEQILLRVYLQSADRSPHTPTYERIIRDARAQGLAGATAMKGILGFGSRGISRTTTWALVEHVPVIVEIADAAERIMPFVRETLPRLMLGGLVTLERASVIMYRHRNAGPSGALRLSAPVAPLSTLPPMQSRDDMKINENGVLLRVFIGESDKSDHAPLYEAIVQKARQLGLAGATVLRGVEGFGANSIVHKSQLLEMSSDLPIVIEIVDTQEKISLLLPHLESMVREGMITMEYVRIVMYRADSTPRAGGSS
jgi:hypothetical protein